MIHNESDKPDRNFSTHVNIHDQYQLHYWMEHFNCTKEELIQAVHEVGESISKIDAFLKAQNNREE
jgi:hypothetical protein